MVCRSVPTPLDVLVLLLLWGWSEIRLAPVRLLCISIAQKYKTARTRRTFGAKYWSSKMQILDLGIWDIVSLNHGWIKVCIKCFSRLCSIVIPFKKMLHAGSEWSLLLAILPSDAKNNQNAMLQVPVVVPTLPSWLVGGLAGLWRLNSCRNQPAAAVQCNAVQQFSSWPLLKSYCLDFCREGSDVGNSLKTFSDPQYFSSTYQPLRTVNQICHVEIFCKFLWQGGKKNLVPAFLKRLLRMTSPSTAGKKSIVDFVAANPSKEILAEHCCTRGWMAKVGLHKVPVQGQVSMWAGWFHAFLLDFQHFSALACSLHLPSDIL